MWPRFQRDEAEERQAEVHGEERDEEPVDFGVTVRKDAAGEGREGFIRQQAVFGVIEPQAEERPEEEGNDGALDAFLQEGGGVVALAVVHQGVAGDHEEHGHSVVEEGFDEGCGQPQPPVWPQPEGFHVGVQHDDGETGDDGEYVYPEFFFAGRLGHEAVSVCSSRRRREAWDAAGMVFIWVFCNADVPFYAGGW